MYQTTARLVLLLMGRTLQTHAQAGLERTMAREHFTATTPAARNQGFWAILGASLT
jgi:hypothetical protein